MWDWLSTRDGNAIEHSRNAWAAAPARDAFNLRFPIVRRDEHWPAPRHPCVSSRWESHRAHARKSSNIKRCAWTSKAR
jgi:hypothetical protein